MDKKKLIHGKKYHQKRKTIIDGIPREAERWLKCERITDTGEVKYNHEIMVHGKNGL